MPNIAVDEHTHQEAKKLCKTLEINLGELVQHSVVYFKKTGIDPSKADSESPHKAIKELDRRVGQVVAYITKQDREKLNPLLEHLIIIGRQLDDTITKLPKSERFEAVMGKISTYINDLETAHEKQMAELKKIHEKIMEENKTERNKLTTNLNNLIQAFNSLQAGQKTKNDTIETKLSKKLLG